MRLDLTYLLAIALASSSAGCADPNLTPVPFRLGSAIDGAVLGGNLRTVTERSRPTEGTYARLPTSCSEPSPDVAIAFGRALAANASFSQPSGPTASGAFSATSTELTTALEGRTAGVLALRDGLAAACQAYANGIIGQDAYALILSQYGNLLVALAGTGTSGSAAPRYTAQETALSALLVSCISEYDPTRLGATTSNPLLSMQRCGKLLDTVMTGRVLKAASVSGSAPTKMASGAGVTINVAK